MCLQEEQGQPFQLALNTHLGKHLQHCVRNLSIKSICCQQQEATASQLKQTDVRVQLLLSAGPGCRGGQGSRDARSCRTHLPSVPLPAELGAAHRSCAPGRGAAASCGAGALLFGFVLLRARFCKKHRKKKIHLWISCDKQSESPGPSKGLVAIGPFARSLPPVAGGNIGSEARRGDGVRQDGLGWGRTGTACRVPAPPHAPAEPPRSGQPPLPPGERRAGPSPARGEVWADDGRPGSARPRSALPLAVGRPRC